MDVHVRRLGPDDGKRASALALLFKSLPCAPRSPSEMSVWLAHTSNILIEATINEVPIGFALGYVLGRFDTARPMLFFYEIEVAVAYRRQGVGQRLVERMKAIASELHAIKMWIQTSPDNEAAQQLYRRAGAVRAEGVDLLYVWTSLAPDGPSCPSQAQGASE